MDFFTNEDQNNNINSDSDSVHEAPPPKRRPKRNSDSSDFEVSPAASDLDDYQPDEQDEQQELEDEVDSHSDHSELEAPRPVHDPRYKQGFAPLHQPKHKNSQLTHLIDEGTSSDEAVQPATTKRTPPLLIMDLDSKTFVRAKRVELEPLPNPTLVNVPAQTRSRVESWVGASVLRVPKTAAWFSGDRLHECEKSVFSDYVQGAQLEKSVDVYMRVRNHILHLYRQSPRTYLTVKKCVEIIDSGLQETMRIHSFLEYYGLINFQARNMPITRSDSMIPLDAEEDEGNFIYSCVSVGKNLLETASQSITSRSCSNCSKECLGYYYRTPLPLSILLCAVCFAMGNYNVDMHPDQFVRMQELVYDVPVSLSTTIDTPENVDEEMQVKEEVKVEEFVDEYDEERQDIVHEREWADEDTLLMLTLLQTHHVDSPVLAKTLDRPLHTIVKKFLGLQIGDSLIQSDNDTMNDTSSAAALCDLFWNGADEDGVNSLSSSSKLQKPSKKGKAASENPLMVFLGAVASSLGCGIASHAARDALNYLVTMNATPESDMDIDLDSLTSIDYPVRYLKETLRVAVDSVARRVDETVGELEQELEADVRRVVGVKTRVVDLKVQVCVSDFGRVV